MSIKASMGMATGHVHIHPISIPNW